MIALETEGTVLRGRFSPRAHEVPSTTRSPLLGRRRDRVVPSTAPRSHPPLHDRPAARGDRAREPGRFHALSLPLAASRPRDAALRRTRSPEVVEQLQAFDAPPRRGSPTSFPRGSKATTRSGSTPCRCRARSRAGSSRRAREPTGPQRSRAELAAVAVRPRRPAFVARSPRSRSRCGSPQPLRARDARRCGRADRRSRDLVSRTGLLPIQVEGARRARVVGSRHCRRDGRPQGLDRARERAPREATERRDRSRGSPTTRSPAAGRSCAKARSGSKTGSSSSSAGRVSSSPATGSSSGASEREPALAPWRRGTGAAPARDAGRGAGRALPAGRFGRAVRAAAGDRSAPRHSPARTRRHPARRRGGIRSI